MHVDYSNHKEPLVNSFVPENQNYFQRILNLKNGRTFQKVWLTSQVYNVVVPIPRISWFKEKTAYLLLSNAIYI